MPTVAPRLIHFCLAQEAPFTNELGEDGHGRKGKFLPPIPLPRRMWAGVPSRSMEICLWETRSNEKPASLM